MSINVRLKLMLLIKLPKKNQLNFYFALHYSYIEKTIKKKTLFLLHHQTCYNIIMNIIHT